VLPLEQSLVGLTVGMGIDDCEVVEDEDEGVVAVVDFDEMGTGLECISIP